MAIGSSAPWGSVAVRLENGRWRSVALATPGRRWELGAVSCGSASSCMAVGLIALPSKGHPDRPLAERWDGRRWTVVPTPALLGELDSVSCVAADDCVAVGQRTNGSSGLIERWNGQGWAVVTPAPTAANRPLAAVSCTAAQACMAVGQLGTGPDQLPFAERLDASGWRIERVDLPRSIGTRSGSLASFEAVSCAGPSFCAASGNYVTSGPYPQALAATWSGGAWHVVAVSHRHPALNLVGVACRSASSCQAVGFAVHGTLAAGWNGTTWSIEATPSSHSTRQFPSEFSAVAAMPAGGYVAVGYAHTVRALVMRHP